MKDDIFKVKEIHDLLKVLNGLLYIITMYYVIESHTILAGFLKFLGLTFLIIVIQAFQASGNVGKMNEILSKSFIQLQSISPQNVANSFLLFKNTMGQAGILGFLIVTSLSHDKSFHNYELLLFLLFSTYLATVAAVGYIEKNVLVPDSSTSYFVKNQLLSLLVTVPVFYLTMHYALSCVQCK